MLIAKKPCRFCGKQFFIGEVIPEELVADPGLQERFGVLAVVDSVKHPVNVEHACIYTQEQADRMVAEAVNSAMIEMEQKQSVLPQAIAEGIGICEETISISVMEKKDAEIAQGMAVLSTPEEIRQVFSILQMNAEDGAKAVADVKSENVLILIHAADSRKTIKNAAKEQAGKLSGNGEIPDDSQGTNTEGDDA